MIDDGQTLSPIESLRARMPFLWINEDRERTARRPVKESSH
jgi:hypothetical protein